MASSGITYTAADIEYFAQAANLSSGRGLCVALHTTEGQVTTATAGTSDVYGVVVEESESSTTGATGGTVGILPIGSGKTCMVKVLGNSVNIAIGDTLTASTGGAAAKTTTDGHFVIGVAKAAATADNVFIPVRLSHQQRAS